MTSNDDDLIEDLVMNYVSVTLSNAFNYSTKFNFQSTQISMVCGYNPRNKSRWIALTDLKGNILLSQTFLKVGKRCELNFTANQYDLNYYVTLKPKIPSKAFPPDYDYSNWANDFDLCFVGYAYSLVERMEINGRKLLVGN